MKTAVEWLVDLLETQKFITKSQIFIAEEMEKQQIMNGYLKGYLEDIPKPSAMHYYEDMAEQYYNETYKSE